MSNHTFTPGQRVSDKQTGKLGTVAKDPTMTAEYPEMIPVHWDNGWRSCAAPAILAPVALNIEHVPDADLAAEIVKRGLEANGWGNLEPWEPTPPAGFRREIFMQCGEDGYDPCEPYGECEHEQDITFGGPGYCESADWRVSTQWTPESGIFYMITHDGLGIWTPEEIVALPKAIEAVKYKIDLDAALEYLGKHSELTKEKVTINRLCEAAQSEGLNWGAMAEAWTILRDGKAGK